MYEGTARILATIAGYQETENDAAADRIKQGIQPQQSKQPQGKRERADLDAVTKDRRLDCHNCMMFGRLRDMFLIKSNTLLSILQLNETPTSLAMLVFLQLSIAQISVPSVPRHGSPTKPEQHMRVRALRKRDESSNGTVIFLSSVYRYR